MRGNGTMRDAILRRAEWSKSEERRRSNNEEENEEKPSDRKPRRKSTKKIQHVQTAKFK
jgi:hypothetical protein